MPSSIKKVILQKQIESTLYQIFPKTDATIVSYTKTVTVNDTPTSVDTTVAAELAALKSTPSGSLSPASSKAESRASSIAAC